MWANLNKETLGMTNPQPDAPQGQPVPPAAEQAPAPKKKSVLPKVLGIVLVVLVAGGFAIYRYMNSASSAQVGDCLSGQLTSQESNKQLNKVDCGSAEATLKVLGRVPDVKDPDVKEELCAPWPDFEGYYWEGKRGGSGAVLCVQQIKK